MFAEVFLRMEGLTVTLTGLDTLTQPLLLTATVYDPALVATNELLFAPLILIPLFLH
jgi:hypothetical protein